MFNSASDLAALPEQKPLGKDTALLATEEHGRPVPYLAGRRRLGLTWITDAWGVRSSAIKRKVGKKKETVGYNYFASFAGVVCLGPVQTLHAIWVDDEQVWTGPMDAGTDDSAAIAVEDTGRSRSTGAPRRRTPTPCSRPAASITRPTGAGAMSCSTTGCWVRIGPRSRPSSST